MTQYTALRSFTKFGTPLAFVVAVLVPVGAGAAMQYLGAWNWLLFLVAVVVGAVAGFLLKVLAELAQVIVDMLLPRTD
jgi:hypothetical protein